MLIHQGWFTALYTQHLLDSQKVSSLKFAYFQGRLSRHITSPSETSLGLGTTWVRQPRSGSCHYPTAATKCNEQPSQATANPVGGKACSSTKGGLLRYILNTALYTAPTYFSKRGYPVTFVLLKNLGINID